MNPRFMGLLLVLVGCLTSAGWGQAIIVPITDDADDGTEQVGGAWYPGGPDDPWNWMGCTDGNKYEIGLRFSLEDVDPNSFVYARLVFPGKEGQVTSAFDLVIRGIAGSAQAFDPDDPNSFPSHQAKTDAAVTWHIDGNWPHNDDEGCEPLYRLSPNILPIINEILQNPNWYTSERWLGLVIEANDPNCDDPNHANYLLAADYAELPTCEPNQPDVTVVIAPRLELYPDLLSACIGPELLGRPTDHSVTIKAVSLLPLWACVVYGTDPNDSNHSTDYVYYGDPNDPNYVPIEILLDGLSANTRYFYRLRCCGDHNDPNTCAAGPLGTFHTWRPSGSTFSFAVQSDVHWRWIRTQPRCLAQYQLALGNERPDANDPDDPNNADFMFDLGDGPCVDRARDRDEMVDWYLEHRLVLGPFGRCVPWFQVLGNHEGEVGWPIVPNDPDDPNNLRPIWATAARKLTCANPPDPDDPNDFWIGAEDANDPNVGWRENYYAFKWGDCLFVALDPFWYTTPKPYVSSYNNSEGDRWRWTLGPDQYDWLCNVLTTQATFKFVFAHHMTGGVTPYGRGGIEAAEFYEWGGWTDPNDPNPHCDPNDPNNRYCFPFKRPGWDKPIHQLMVDNQVAAFFHGHDHCFVKQDLDGIVYLEVPRPDDYWHRINSNWADLYDSNDIFFNSGHVRAKVHQIEPDNPCDPNAMQVTIEYVRARRDDLTDPNEPDDAYYPNVPNGAVWYSFTISDYNNNGRPDSYDVCVGDMNCDGTIDWADLNPFVLYLSNDEAWQAEFRCCIKRNGDINCDGTYGTGSFGDINPFVALMTQCGSGCNCPGPIPCPCSP